MLFFSISLSLFFSFSISLNFLCEKMQTIRFGVRNLLQLAYALISRLETRFSATFPVYFHHLHNGHAFRNAYGCRSHHKHTHTHTHRHKQNAFMSVALPHFLCSHCRNQKLMWVELDETENPKNGVQKKPTEYKRERIIKPKNEHIRYASSRKREQANIMPIQNEERWVYRNEPL